MQSLFYLAAVVGFALVVWWYIKNDKIGPDEGTTGFFAMEPPTPRKQEPGTFVRGSHRPSR